MNLNTYGPSLGTSPAAGPSGAQSPRAQTPATRNHNTPLDTHELYRKLSQLSPITQSPDNTKQTSPRSSSPFFMPIGFESSNTTPTPSPVSDPSPYSDQQLVRETPNSPNVSHPTSHTSTPKIIQEKSPRQIAKKYTKKQRTLKELSNLTLNEINERQQNEINKLFEAYEAYEQKTHYVSQPSTDTPNFEEIAFLATKEAFEKQLAKISLEYDTQKANIHALYKENKQKLEAKFENKLEKTVTHKHSLNTLNTPD